VSYYVLGHRFISSFVGGGGDLPVAVQRHQEDGIRRKENQGRGGHDGREVSRNSSEFLRSE
jgi:hypothetical protein